VSLWGLWFSVIASPADIGVVVYTIAAISMSVYIKFGCGKTARHIHDLLIMGGFTDELLLECLNSSLNAYSTTILDPSINLKETPDPSEIIKSITKYTSDTEEAYQALDQTVKSCCIGPLSPVPLYHAIISVFNRFTIDSEWTDESTVKVSDAYNDYIEKATLITEFYAHFRLTALSASTIYYHKHVSGLLNFIQSQQSSNFTTAIQEKDLLQMAEVDMIAVMNSYNLYLKSKKAEDKFIA
jgi:hypothetical protein